MKRPGHRSKSFLAATLVLGLIVSSCGAGDQPLTLAGTVIDPHPDVGSVALPDAAAGGTDYVTKAEPGRLLLVYFGYTYCPDICPASLADLRAAVEGLGEQAERIDVAMISVDPTRDTADVLLSYIQAFFDDAHALRTDDPERLVAAAGAYGAGFQVTEYEDGTFSVGHSAFIYAVDADGLVRVQWDFGTPVEVIQSDLMQMLGRI